MSSRSSRNFRKRRAGRSFGGNFGIAQPLAFDLALPQGRLRAHRFCEPGDRLVLCLPGLSSNSRTYDSIGEGLAGHGPQPVSLDLRGRGHSEVTPRGTYGWLRHAHDVLDAATALGAPSFDLVGHSMGAYVALQTAQLAPERVRRLVLIDGLGIPRYAAFLAILRGLERLKMSYATADEYIAAIRSLGLVVPWSEHWERAFRYDLATVNGRVRSRTSGAAVFEDVAYAGEHDPRPLWRGLEMPILVLRAAIPMVGRDGFILTEFDTDRFLGMTPSARAMNIAANHLGIVTHLDAVNAILAFIR